MTKSVYLKKLCLCKRVRSKCLMNYIFRKTVKIFLGMPMENVFYIYRSFASVGNKFNRLALFLFYENEYTITVHIE